MSLSEISILLIVIASWLPPTNEVWGKVIFSVACVKNSVHREVGGSASVHAGIPPPTRHRTGADHPGVNPPKETPPGANSKPPTRPSRAYPTPLEQCILGDTVNKRVLCILLECNLVVIVLSWNLTEKRPPWLVKQPPREIIFLPKEDIRVPCRAEGQPLPQWV